MMNAVHPESSMNRPDALPFEPFQDAVAAVDRLEEIYSRNKVHYICRAMRHPGRAIVTSFAE